MADPNISTEPHSPARRRLWFALIAPGAAWALHEMLCSFVAALACERHHSSAVARGLVLAITLVALAFTVGGGVLGYRLWQTLSEQEPLRHAEGQGAEQMLAMGAIFLGVVFTLGVLWGGLPSLMFSNLCEAHR